MAMRSRMLMRSLTLMAALAGAAAVEAAFADPGARKVSKVSVCSSYGNGCYSATVRRGRFGPEMRLKGGTWIDCRGDCRETLREETVDFWETQNDKALAIR